MNKYYAQCSLIVHNIILSSKGGLSFSPLGTQQKVFYNSLSSFFLQLPVPGSLFASDPRAFLDKNISGSPNLEKKYFRGGRPMTSIPHPAPPPTARKKRFKGGRHLPWGSNAHAPLIAGAQENFKPFRHPYVAGRLWGGWQRPALAGSWKRRRKCCPVQGALTLELWANCLSEFLRCLGGCNSPLCEKRQERAWRCVSGVSGHVFSMLA